MSKFLKLPEQVKLSSECQEKASELIKALNDVGYAYDKFMESGWLDTKSVYTAFDDLKRAKERDVISSQEANSISSPLGQALADSNWRDLHKVYDRAKFVDLFGEDVYEKTRHIGGGEIELSISEAEQALLATLLEKVVECECQKH